MKGRHSLSVPVVGPEQGPGRTWGQRGSKVDSTEHMSVPRLARHLVAELPREFDGLWFSATVYRYRLAAPWIIDIEVFGVPDAEQDCPSHSDGLIWQIEQALDAYQWCTEVESRFAGPNIVLLREYEQGECTPGRVSVRRYYLREKPRGWWETVRSLVTGWRR